MLQPTLLKLGVSLVVVAAAVAAGGLVAKRAQENEVVSVPSQSISEVSTTPPSSPTPMSSTTSPSPTNSPTPSTPVRPTPSPSAQVAATFLIKSVPFIQQAPNRNWDAVHEETCEEAAVLTVVHLLKGDTDVALDQQEQELQDIVTWENDRFGTYTDTTASQTAQILSDKFGLGDRVHVVTLDTVTDLENLVSKGLPVIVPAAGRLLKNTNFKAPGPIYHMVVAIGFTKTAIITNDPGTIHGEGYSYPTETFWNAVHDFVDKTDTSMATGAKTVIVVDPKA